MHILLKQSSNKRNNNKKGMGIITMFHTNITLTVTLRVGTLLCWYIYFEFFNVTLSAYLVKEALKHHTKVYHRDFVLFSLQNKHLRMYGFVF